jgi:hypothetical protein
VNATRFLRAEEIDAAIEEVSRLAAAAGVRVALAGGCAMQLHGSPRLTVDVDVVAAKPIRGLRRLEPLTFGGHTSLTSAGTIVDVLICDTEYEAAFSDALIHATRVPKVPMRVVRTEHLAILKMIARRGKDQLDLAWLITNDKLDIPKTHRAIRKLLGGQYAVDDFEAFAAEARWRRDTGRE